MLKTTMILLASIAILVSGCTEKYQAVERKMDRPISCATAEQDLQTLEQEKARTHDQVIHGVSSVTPIGLVTGLATGTQGTKMKVASGDYNRMIDRRIAEIKASCGIE